MLCDTKDVAGGSWCLWHASKDRGEKNMRYNYPLYTKLVGDVCDIEQYDRDTDSNSDVSMGYPYSKPRTGQKTGHNLQCSALPRAP